MYLRPATAADHPAILAINSTGQPGVSPLTPSDLAAFAAPPFRLIVAELDGYVAGYLIAVPSGADYDGEEYRWLSARLTRFLYVDQIAISPDNRRAGVASALYGWAAQHASERSLDTIACEVNLDPPNPQSLAFHEAAGLTSIGTLDVSDGRRVTLLARSVDGAGSIRCR